MSKKHQIDFRLGQQVRMCQYNLGDKSKELRNAINIMFLGHYYETLVKDGVARNLTFPVVLKLLEIRNVVRGWWLPVPGEECNDE